MAKRPEELYFGEGGQNATQYTPQHQRYASQQEYTPGQPPNIHFQQATPQGSSFPTTPSSNNGLETPSSASSSRQGPAAGYSASTTVPNMSQTNPQQYAPPSRSAILHSNHSHSRSSPAGMDQRYIPFSGTPTSTPGQSSKMFSPQTPIGSTSYSPLGLSDIRPRADSDLEKEGAGTAAMFDYSPVQTNSNYLAPWATYAYDWCKWPVNNGNSCGKMAVGSYLEDPHNFVSRSRGHRSASLASNTVLIQ